MRTGEDHLAEETAHEGTPAEGRGLERAIEMSECGQRDKEMLTTDDWLEIVRCGFVW